MVSQDELPTGNLHLAERTSLLLRRDYFYTGSTRPTGENPLLLNVTGYLAISVVALAFLGSFNSWLEMDVLFLGALTVVLLELFFVCFVLHLVLETVSTLWRIARGLASTGS